MCTMTHLKTPNSRLSLVTCLMILGLGVVPESARAEDLNRIILRVNEEILTLHEYELRKEGEISTVLADSRIESGERQERLEQIGRMVVQNSFSEMLLLSYANQHAIRVTDRDVSDSVNEMMARQGIETDAQLQQALQSNNMTLDELKNNARRELIWQQVVGREVQPKVVISDEEARGYYRNNQDQFKTPETRWLKEVIVLEASGLEDAELRRTAEEIRQALVAGGEAEEIIAPYKEREVATGLIDLEWLRAEELETALSTAAWAVSPGDFSEPVAGRGGYHIIHVAGVREASIKPLDEVEGWIRQREYNSRFNRELHVFLTKLETEAHIVEDLPSEAVGYQALAPDYETEDELELFRAPIVGSEEGIGKDDGEVTAEDATGEDD